MRSTGRVPPIQVPFLSLGGEGLRGKSLAISDNKDQESASERVGPKKGDQAASRKGNAGAGPLPDGLFYETEADFAKDQKSRERKGVRPRGGPSPRKKKKNDHKNPPAKSIKFQLPIAPHTWEEMYDDKITKKDPAFSCAYDQSKALIRY